MTTKLQKSLQRFAICINTDNEDMLTPRMVYEVLPDESAAKSDYIRVVDNEGEDYLYPAKYFVFVDFPQPVKRALLRAQPPTLGGISTRRSRVSSAQRRNL